jgi:hypothetical protein
MFAQALRPDFALPGVAVTNGGVAARFLVIGIAD